MLLRSGSFVKGHTHVGFSLNRDANFEVDIPIIASWVANDIAWYASPSTVDDASVLASFSTFIVGLSKATLEKFLSFYPVSDFEHEVQPDDIVTAQYYRAARINRDVWFTCPVIDFTWQHAKEGSTNTRLYELNQTRFEPVWKSLGIPHWRVSHHSDIPYILNGHVAGGGDNSPAQQRLASLLSGDAAAFAHTGHPTRSDSRVLRDWPTAYHDSSARDSPKEHPDQMTVYVVGGPHGSGPASISKSNGTGSLARERALEQEKLFQRCEFINAIQEEIGV